VLVLRGVVDFVAFRDRLHFIDAGGDADASLARPAQIANAGLVVIEESERPHFLEDVRLATGTVAGWRRLDARQEVGAGHGHFLFRCQRRCSSRSAITSSSLILSFFGRSPRLSAAPPNDEGGDNDRRRNDEGR
jgi:hypothetical protein